MTPTPQPDDQPKTVHRAVTNQQLDPVCGTDEDDAVTTSDPAEVT